jgi:hypothetical protein
MGFEQVWTKFGRQVVGNLTTITNSLENFAAALLGFHWANELNQEVNENDRHGIISATFLKYEQLSAYLRYQGGSKSIMGITRVKGRMDDEVLTSFNLGTTSRDTILSDQVGYGLWGFYSSASRDSGLIHGNERELTAKGLRIAQLIESKLDKPRLIKLIQRAAVERSDIEELSAQYLAAINDQEVASQVILALMQGDLNAKNGSNLQYELWQKTQQLVRQQGIESLVNNNLGDFFAKLKSLGLSDGLNHKLADIAEVERVLVALNHVFHYCRTNDGKHIDDINQNLLEQNYQFEHLPAQLPSLDVHNKDKIQDALNSLREHDFKSVIHKVAELNKKVMVDRQGAPWIEVDGKKAIKVRMKLEKFKLFKQSDLLERWDYDYFIGSFLDISRNYLGSRNG